MSFPTIEKCLETAAELLDILLSGVCYMIQDQLGGNKANIKLLVKLLYLELVLMLDEQFFPVP